MLGWVLRFPGGGKQCANECLHQLLLAAGSGRRGVQHVSCGDFVSGTGDSRWVSFVKDFCCDRFPLCCVTYYLAKFGELEL